MDPAERLAEQEDDAIREKALAFDMRSKSLVRLSAIADRNDPEKFVMAALRNGVSPPAERP